MERVEKIKIGFFVCVLVSLGVLTLCTGYRRLGECVNASIRNPEVWWAKAFIAGADNGLNEAFFEKEFFVNCYGSLQKLQGRQIVTDVDKSNTVYLLSSGLLTFTSPRFDMSRCAGKLNELSGWLEQQGIGMLYVQTPPKTRQETPDLPYWLTDYHHFNTNDLLEQLTAVKVLDLRKELQKEQIRTVDFFYKTDHHWNTDAAFWACGKTVTCLGESFGFSFDSRACHIDNYTRHSLPAGFLGSQGKRVGEIYGGIDDYEWLLPRFETDFQVTIDGAEASGNFETTIFLKEKVDKTKKPSTNRYYAYFGDDHGEKIIINKRVEKGRVLLLQDSFGIPFSAFLALGVHELRVLDLRSFREQTLKEYVSDWKPDVVVLLYNPMSYTKKREHTMFEFGL